MNQIINGIPETALIHTKQGLVSISELKEGDLVLSSEGYRKVKGIQPTPKQPVIKINTEIGEVSCFAETHLGTLAEDKIIPECGHEVIKEDTLCFYAGNLQGKTEDYYLTIDHEETTESYKLDVDFAWFLGFIQGNANIFPNYEYNGLKASISFTTNLYGLPILRKLQGIINQLGINVRIHKDHSLKIFRVILYSKKYAWYFSKFKTNNKEVNVPEFILTAEQKIRSAYLAGMFDAIGNRVRPIIAITNYYAGFIKQIQSLYASLGIHTKRHTKIIYKRNVYTKYFITIEERDNYLKFKNALFDYSIKLNGGEPGTNPYAIESSPKLKEAPKLGFIGKWLQLPIEQRLSTVKLPVKIYNILNTTEELGGYKVEVEGHQLIIDQGVVISTK